MNKATSDLEQVLTSMASTSEAAKAVVDVIRSQSSDTPESLDVPAIVSNLRGELQGTPFEEDLESIFDEKDLVTFLIRVIRSLISAPDGESEVLKYDTIEGDEMQATIRRSFENKLDKENLATNMSKYSSDNKNYWEKQSPFERFVQASVLAEYYQSNRVKADDGLRKIIESLGEEF